MEGSIDLKASGSFIISCLSENLKKQYKCHINSKYTDKWQKSCYYNPDDTIDFVVKKKAMSDEVLFSFCQEICFKEFD